MKHRFCCPLSMLAILFFLPSLSGAQEKFPNSWTGEWSGELLITLRNGDRQNVPMTLTIRPTAHQDTFVYRLRYSGQEARDYRLVEIDPENGHYLIDECNSILIDAWLIRNELLTSFRVEDTQINSSLRLEGDTLRYRIVSQRMANARLSGGEQVNGQRLPAVESYILLATQEAVLRRTSDD